MTDTCPCTDLEEGGEPVGEEARGSAFLEVFFGPDGGDDDRAKRTA